MRKLHLCTDASYDMPRSRTYSMQHLCTIAEQAIHLLFIIKDGQSLGQNQ